MSNGLEKDKFRMDHIEQRFPAWIVLLGGFIPGILGILHLAFTESKIAQQGDLPNEFLRAFRTGWVIEGIFLLFIFVLVISLYPHLRRKSKAARKVGLYIGAALVVLGIWHTTDLASVSVSGNVYAPLLVLSALLIWLPLAFHRRDWS